MIVEAIEIKKVNTKYTFCIHTNAISVGSILQFNTSEEALAAALDVLQLQQLTF